MAPGSITSVSDATALLSVGSHLDVATVFREHGPNVHRLLRRLGVPPSDVDDAFQEVFVIVHRKLGELERPSSVRSWVYGICIRVSAKYRRLRSAARELSPEASVEPIDPTTPIENVTAKQARAVLSTILDQLDPDKRAVFVLYELEERPMPEVAQMVGCPVQTAYWRLRAAREEVAEAVRRYRAQREFK